MLKIFALGGPVMIPLLFCSIFALAIGIERLYYLLRSSRYGNLLEDIRYP